MSITPPKFPCPVCNKNVNVNHHAICCDICDQWVHIKCNRLNEKDYAKLKNDPNKEGTVFYCIDCMSKLLPFNSLTDADFYSIVERGVVLPDTVIDNDQLAFLKCKDYLNKLNQYVSDTQNENDEFSSAPVDCKYYTIDDFAESKFNSKKTTSIFHINIHSIEKHIDELRSYLLLGNFQFDVLAISESKLQIDAQPKVDITIAGYHYPLNSPTKATKGGVLLYIKENLLFKPRPDLQKVMTDEKYLESNFVEIIHPKCKNDVVGVIYRHPTGNPVDFLESHLKPLLDEKLSMDIINKNVYIAGDFNFDLTNISHQETSDFFDTMTTNQLLPTISLPTKLNSKHNTLHDNIFTNQFNPDMVSGNFTVLISDHLASFLIVPNKNKQFLPKKHNIFKRDAKNFNQDLFLKEINETNWDEVLQANKRDVDYSFNSFYDKTEEILDRHMPKRKITKTEFKQRYKPWITFGILKSLKRKARLLNKYIRTKDPARKQAVLDEYKTLRNQISELSKTSKTMFYQTYFTENNNNLRKIWQGIKEVINIKNKSSDTPTCVTQNDHLITDPTGISNAFNDYYSDIAENILQKRKYTGDGNYMKYMPPPLEKTLLMTETNPEEIKNIILTFNVNKATGPCSIPPKILNMICDNIAYPIAMLANMSFLTGIHPERLKTAKVIPIYKNGSKMLTSNYRPISLLSNLNKILEKLMFNRVNSFLEDENIIYQNQFGFRPKHSTNHALITITEQIKKTLDHGDYACGVFVDFQKAFDTVNHNILLSKLDRYGIRGPTLDWFRSYLTNRYQFVSILGFDSDKKIILHGVPQGSVLGPLLFLIYINDLHNAIRFSTTYLFADDTNLLHVNSNLKKLQSQMNADLKNLCSWLLANQISLNKTKTELIYFKKPNTTIPFNKIKINGLKLYPSKSVKYLGIHLDEHLNGSAHVNVLIPKLRRANGMISKIRHYTSLAQTKSIYHAIFASHMTYGCQVWGQSFNETYIKKIQILQNNAMRLISFAPNFRDHVSPIYKSYNILKIKDLIDLKNMLFVHDYLNNKLPESFSDFFSLMENHGTRTETSLAKVRDINPPLRYIQYELTEPDMRPQIHAVHYRFRNLNIQGELTVPKYNSKKYGRNSMNGHSVLRWNFFKKIFPNKDFSSLSRDNLKHIISNYYMEKYRDNVLE